MTENLEKQLIKLIATDRIDKPISSMSGKLKRAKPKIAESIDLDPYRGSFKGSRVYGRVEAEDKMKARGIRDGVEAFCEAYPSYGTILEKFIEEERLMRETYLYFGVNEGCRLTAEDYMGVMTDLGFTETTSRSLYPELMEVSYKLSRSRNEKERSILIG